MTEQANKHIETVKNLRKEGKTYAEISKALGMSVPSVNYYLKLGRKRSKVSARKIKKGEKKNGQVQRSKGKGNRISFEGYVEIRAAYATGKFEEFLRSYAESERIPFEALTRRVAEALHALTSR